MPRKYFIAEQIISNLREVESLAFSRDGNILAAGSDDKTVILWNLAPRREIGQALAAHSDRVVSVVFSSHGKLLAPAATMAPLNCGIWQRVCLLSSRYGPFRGISTELQAQRFSRIDNMMFSFHAILRIYFPSVRKEGSLHE